MSRVGTLEEARAAKRLVAQSLAGRDGVLGIGITRVGGGYAVRVNLSRQPAAVESIPTEVAGVPVRIEIVGEIRKQE